MSSSTIHSPRIKETNSDVSDIDEFWNCDPTLAVKELFMNKNNKNEY
jgi:hypothetical protein